MPKSVAFNGKYSLELFNRKGELRNIRKLKFWDLHSVLSDKYRMSPEAASSLASFLLPMLEFDPAKRATAAKMLQHPWIDTPQAKAATPSSRGSAAGKTLDDAMPTSPVRNSAPVSPVNVDSSRQAAAAAAAAAATGVSPSRLVPLLSGARAGTAPPASDRRPPPINTGVDSSSSQGAGSAKRLQPLSESLQGRASTASSHSPIRLVGQVLGGMGLMGSSTRDLSTSTPQAAAGPSRASIGPGIVPGAASGAAAASPTRLAPIFGRSSTSTG
jgi:serine/threonine protein kinase